MPPPRGSNVFKLGYRQPHARLPGAARTKPPPAGNSRPGCRRSESSGKETGHEHLNGCVVFPIHDLGRQGRATLRARLAAAGDQLRHLYLAGPQCGVWNAAALLPGADWILCEALIDALTLWCHGWRNVTASYGVHGFTAEHMGLARERKPGRMVIIYDADTAGHAQAAAVAQELAAKGIAVWRATPPEGKDINDVAREADDPAAALRAVIDGAKKIAGPVVVTMPAAVPVVAPARVSSLAATAANASAAKKGRRLDSG